MIPLDESEGLPQTLVLSLVLFITLAIQTGSVNGIKEYLLLVVISPIVMAVCVIWAVLMLGLGFSFIAALLTAVARSRPVHAADTDMLFTIPGCALGGMIGLALIALRYASENSGSAPSYGKQRKREAQ